MAEPRKQTDSRHRADALKMAKLLRHQLQVEVENLVDAPHLRDAEEILDPSEEERDRMLDVLHRESPYLEARTGRENVYGMAPIRADISSHEALRQRIQSLWPDRIVVGEEGLPAAWDAWRACSEGTYIANLDSLDGSMLYDTVGFGFGATASLHRRSADGTDVLIYTVTVNSSGFLLIYIAAEDAVYVAGGKTYAASRLIRVTGDRLHPAARPGMVACVAARGEHRTLVAPLMASGGGWGLPANNHSADPDLTVSTLGGAPAAVGLVLGRLSALVLPQAQTLHDAAPMVALAALGISVFDDAGRAVDYSTLKALFNRLARPDDGDVAYHPIPRLVFARTAAFGELLARRVFRTNSDGTAGTWTIAVIPNNGDRKERHLRIV